MKKKLPALLLALALVFAFPAAGHALSGLGGKTHTNSIGMEFVLIPAGSFTREAGKNEFNEPVRAKVTISKPFYFGKYEVTQEQWVAVMETNPSGTKGRTNPVENVSWDDAQEFIRRLNAKEGHSRYRLPTEAEWEYASRGGREVDPFFGEAGKGNTNEELARYAWFTANSGGSPHPVGRLKPNPWGLYDIYGNVWEWAQDWYGEYPTASVTDPRGPSSGSYRVLRGGSWFYKAEYCRSSIRIIFKPDSRIIFIGFRLALSPE